MGGHPGPGDCISNIPVIPWCQRFLGFQLEITPGVVKKFVFTVLPFGLSRAPCLFFRVMKPIRIQGIWNSGYLDVFLFLGKSPDGLTRKLDYVWSLLSATTPSQCEEGSRLLPPRKASPQAPVPVAQLAHFPSQEIAASPWTLPSRTF